MALNSAKLNGDQDEPDHLKHPACDHPGHTRDASPPMTRRHGDASRLPGMEDPAKKKARVDAKRAQAKFERTQSQLEGAAASRRESFRRAAAAGLSMAEIGDAVGLHRTRVNQIIKGK